VENGELLTLAEAAGFEVPVTTDQDLSYQQNLKNYRLQRQDGLRLKVA
jgi:hypothetical protein